MELKNYAAMTIGTVIAVMLFATMVVPVIGEATTTEKTFTNGGYFTYDAVADDTDVTIVWEMASPDVVKIGDNTITMPEGASSWTIVGSENFTARFYRNATVTGIQCYGTSGYISGNTGTAGLTSLTVAVSAASMVITAGENTKTYTMGDHGFVLNPIGKGALTLKYSDEAAYINEDTEVYLCGTTFVTGSGTNDFVGVFGWGTVDDLTMSSFYGNSSPNTVSFGDVTATYSAVSGYVDLYLLEKFTFPLTQNGATVTATYSYFVVPTEVTAELSIHPDDTSIALLSIIPVLIVVGLIIGVATIFLSRRE